MVSKLWIDCVYTVQFSRLSGYCAVLFLLLFIPFFMQFAISIVSVNARARPHCKYGSHIIYRSVAAIRNLNTFTAYMYMSWSGSYWRLLQILFPHSLLAL